MSRHTSMPSAGEHEVEQDQIWVVELEGIKRTITLTAPFGIETLLSQHDLEHLCQRCIIVDDENAVPHGRLPIHVTHLTP